MNKNIDLTKLLKQCPKGTKFYSRFLGSVEFCKITSDNYIEITDKNGYYIRFTPNGIYQHSEEAAEIDLFPSKDQRDWSKWQRPLVDGDIVTNKNNGGNWIGIYREDTHSNLTFSSYCYLRTDGIFCANSDTEHAYYGIRLATEKEKKELFDVIKKEGYEWDAEKKELKPLQLFKDGDILYIDCNDGDDDYEEYQYIFILKEINGDEIHCYCYVDIAGENERFETCWLTTMKYTPRFASLIEKEKLFDTIKSRGYKWNDKEKKLEKLIVPKFKVGDTIRSKNGLQTYKITGVTSEYYSSKIQGNDCVAVLPIKDQDDFILVPNKFDYKTLQHFDKVLVRYDDDTPWCTDFFSYYDDEMRAVCTGEVHYEHCIPYNEDTKHLVGKLKDAPEFYKYWEAR